MMEKLIKLKHWQVSLILIGLMAMSTLLQEKDLIIGNITTHVLVAFFAVLYVSFLFGWVLSIGLFLNKIPDNPYRFNKWILIVAVLFCIIGYSLLNIDRIVIDNELDIASISNFYTPLTCFGIMYTFYNVPKSLKSIELDRKALLKEWIVDAVLLIALPIGIWFIQPRMKRIYLVNEMLKNENKLNTNQ